MAKTHTSEENARLISVAPDMLNMLNVVEAHLKDIIEGRGIATSKIILARVQSLIKKATV